MLNFLYEFSHFIFQIDVVLLYIHLTYEGNETQEGHQAIKKEVLGLKFICLRFNMKAFGYFVLPNDI
jgi:hypothetical protein